MGPFALLMGLFIVGCVSWIILVSSKNPSIAQHSNIDSKSVTIPSVVADVVLTPELLGYLENYVSVDLETTGLSPQNDEIIEIAGGRYINGIESERVQSLVNPRIPLPGRIVQLTGITDKMLINAPYIESVLPQFLDFLVDSVIVAHNARFDADFIENSAEKHLGCFV